MNTTTFTNPIYVKTDNNLFYAVESATTYNHDDCDRIELNLKLVCGHDYINPDYNDIQGYVTPNNFIDDVQEETIYQYYLTESAKDCLIDNGYEIIEELPTIYKRGEIEQ